ncbi:IS110 family transposase [Agrobacterium larrymoorei]|uniref:IS110 family transposase n=1 Tax=Agrobacterium larrymoorei TaxID=160699 RepID=A0AAF0KIL4_9HYPH|nr:IS110 family transposase [Agrobacterium larrymoorei]WHA40979.1 IS110 family transposase [Agrobacterium larrymoorei]
MIHPVSIGCDISKAFLDIADPQTKHPIRLPNTTSDIGEWLDTLAGREVVIIFEATGRYDQLLRQALDKRHIPYCRVNPARARDFAKATGRMAKTDRIDAKMLARMGDTLSPPLSKPVDPARQELKILHTRRDQLVAMRKQERLRIHTAEPFELDSIERHLGWLDAEITAIEKQYQAHLNAHEELQEQGALLCSIPGIGHITSCTLRAHMPELGEGNPKHMAALAGLAPFNAESGKHQGERRIMGGRKRVRDALYIAALVVYRLKTPFADFIQTMQAKGKPFKVIIIAIAHKLLSIANAIIRDRTAFKKA